MTQCGPKMTGKSAVIPAHAGIQWAWGHGPPRGRAGLAAATHFFPAPIRQRWREHVSGQRDHTHSLWAVLMFQAWLGEQ